MITIYGRIMSRASRPIWALEEAGVPYKHVPHDHTKGETRTPEYLAINPSGKIPALSDGAVTMSESFAMNIYIAQTYGKGALWPADAPGQAKCLQWTLWAATELEPSAVGRLMEVLFKKEPDRDQKVIDALAAKTRPALDVLQGALAKSPYLAGQAFSVADLNAAAVMEYLVRTNFDIAPWPAVDKWLKDCFARPAYLKLGALRKAAAPPAH